MEGYWVFGFLEKFEINVCEGASAENVEIHHFSNFKTRSVSQWPENPTICDDIEMARYAVVSSIIPLGCRGLKSPASPISPFSFRPPACTHADMAVSLFADPRHTGVVRGRKINENR